MRGKLREEENEENGEANSNEMILKRNKGGEETKRGRLEERKRKRNR